MKRKHIPIIEIAAAALADKLPQSVRDAARGAQLPARTILRMFTADHIKLHCWGGDDKWWNLDMRRRGSELKAKDAADTSRAAKAKRIDKKQQRHFARLEARTVDTSDIPEATKGWFKRAKVVWPKGRKIPSRPFRRRQAL